MVAGMNYDIRIKVAADRFIQVRVYQSLPPVTYTLTHVDFKAANQRIIVGRYVKAEVKDLVAPANGVKEEVEKEAAAEKQPQFECYEVVEGTLSILK